MFENFLSYFLRGADQQRALSADQSIEVCARDGWPAAFPAYICKGTGVSRKEIIHRGPARCGHIAEGVNPNAQLFRSKTSPAARLPVQIHQGTKTARFPADDGDHQRQTQRARTDE